MIIIDLQFICTKAVNDADAKWKDIQANHLRYKADIEQAIAVSRSERISERERYDINREKYQDTLSKNIELEKIVAYKNKEITALTSKLTKALNEIKKPKVE
jgi:hypothetical protein